MAYKITGMDRDSGEPMTVIVDAESEEEALGEAFKQNIVVEKIEHLKGANPKPPRSVSEETQRRNDLMRERRDRVHPSARSSELPGSRIQLNDVATIALGVFVGLLVFSLLSPLVIAIVFVIWGSFASGLSGG